MKREDIEKKLVDYNERLSNLLAERNKFMDEHMDEMSEYHVGDVLWNIDKAELVTVQRIFRESSVGREVYSLKDDSLSIINAELSDGRSTRNTPYHYKKLTAEEVILYKEMIKGYKKREIKNSNRISLNLEPLFKSLFQSDMKELGEQAFVKTEYGYVEYLTDEPNIPQEKRTKEYYSFINPDTRKVYRNDTTFKNQKGCVIRSENERRILLMDEEIQSPFALTQEEISLCLVK